MAAASIALTDFSDYDPASYQKYYDFYRDIQDT
jgi:hypothetical protein